MTGRILVIDDEAQIRKFLRIALEAGRYEVIEAANGIEGVANCATGAPGVVVLDLGLLDIDGREVVRRIREWSEVPILTLSVRQAETEKVGALDAGANDYVVKPFGIAELLARVRGLLRRSGYRMLEDDGFVRFGLLGFDTASSNLARGDPGTVSGSSLADDTSRALPEPTRHGRGDLGNSRLSPKRHIPTRRRMVAATQKIRDAAAAMRAKRRSASLRTRGSSRSATSRGGRSSGLRSSQVSVRR
jgi:CheY-like chemotaxis protein